MLLELCQQIFDFLRAADEGRNHDGGRAVVRNATVEIELGQHPRRHERREAGNAGTAYHNLVSFPGAVSPKY